MKKVFLTLILTIGAVLIFTSCKKKQKIKTDRFDDQTINMSYQALSSIKMLETKEEYNTVKRLSNRVANQEVVEKEVINKYLGLMQELLNDNGGFKTETKVSDKPEYSNLVEITTRNFQNQTVVYSLYYNEISSEIKTEIDEDDLTEEIEVEKRISGIAIVGEKEFILEGIVKEEKENDEVENESIFKIIEDENNYVIVQEETETEQNEYTHEYKYIIVSNGKKVNEVEFELEQENGELSIKLKEVSNNTKTSYKFKVKEEKGYKYIKVEVKEGNNVTNIKVRLVLNTETNTYTYEYKYI